MRLRARHDGVSACSCVLYSCAPRASVRGDGSLFWWRVSMAVPPSPASLACPLASESYANRARSAAVLAHANNHTRNGYGDCALAHEPRELGLRPVTSGLRSPRGRAATGNRISRSWGYWYPTDWESIQLLNSDGWTGQLPRDRAVGQRPL